MNKVTTLTRKPNYDGLIERIQLLSTNDKLRLIADVKEIISQELTAQINEHKANQAERERLLASLNGNS